MRKIAVIVPTRGRPANARRLWDSFVETTATGWVSVHFCVDEDDPYLESYIDNLPGRVNVGSPNRLGPWLNLMSKSLLADNDIIGFVGDDVISRTYGWDEIVMNHFEENAIIYPNDGWQGAGLPTSVFMDANLIKKLGYMVHPYFKHLYIDNHWKALGEELGTLTYLDDVHMEHMHPFAGKAADDETYRTANSPEQYSEDGKAYQRWEMFELGYDTLKAQF